MSFNVATSEDHYTRTVMWERARYVGTKQWIQGVSVTKTDSEDGYGDPCGHAATAQVDYPRATVTITVPNRCLGRTVPTWVRIDDLETRSKEPRGIGS